MFKTTTQLSQYKPPSNIRKILALLAGFLIFLIISLLLFGPSSFSQLHDAIFNNSGDPESFIWFLHWWPFALSHHINPFMTKYVWYPQEYDLAWSTTMPTIALIMAPVTIIWGAVVSFNLIALIAPALSAFTGFLLLYYLSKKYLPSMVAGYIFGFSSYETGQLLGHPNLYISFLIPLIILLFMLRLDNKIKNLTYIISTAVLLSLEFGISLEIYTTFTVFFVLGLVIVSILASQKRKQLHQLLIAFGLGVVGSIILCSPYLYYLLKGIGNVPKVINSPVLFSADLLNFVIPTPITLIGSNMFRAISVHFAGNVSEDGVYIGVPLLLLLIYILYEKRKTTHYKLLFLALSIFIILALGPILHINGHSCHIVLPWVVALIVPFVKNALPVRFSLYIFLTIAIIVGLWLADNYTKRAYYLSTCLVLVSMAFIVPNPSFNKWMAVDSPRLFNKKIITHYISRQSNTLILPFYYNGNGMLYQYESGMAFTQTGGYAGFAPITDSTNRVVESLLQGSVYQNFTTDFKNFCVINKVNEVVITANTPQTLVTSLKSLSWHEQLVGNSLVMYVP